MTRWRPPPLTVALALGLFGFSSSIASAFAQGELTPQLPGITHYGAPVPVPDSPIAWSITALASDVAETWAKPRPTLDGALSRTAQILAKITAAGGRHARGTVDFAGCHSGVTEPIPVILAIRTNRTDKQSITQALRQGLDNAIGLRSFNRLGVGIHREPGTDSTVIVVALTERYAKLLPVPKQLKSGAQIQVIGNLSGQYRQPILYLTGPDGESQSIKVYSQEKAFAAPLRCQADGTHRMEILAEAGAGPVVLVNIPFYCGTRAPTSVSLNTEKVEKVSPAAAEARILQLVNAARKKTGRGPLISHAGATQVARNHSIDMRDNRFVAHVSKRTGGVGDRARLAGIPVSWLAENVGLADSPDSVHEGLMESPGHRAAILTDEGSHIGIGVTYDGDGGLLVTQVFLKPLLPLTVNAGRKEILTSLLKLSQDGRIGIDPRIDAIAGQMAEIYAQDQRTAKQLSTEATRRLRKAGLSNYGGFRALVGTTRKPEELLTNSNVRPDLVKGVGVGVAIGKRADKDSKEYFVVVLLGTK